MIPLSVLHDMHTELNVVLSEMWLLMINIVTLDPTYKGQSNDK